MSEKEQVNDILSELDAIEYQAEQAEQVEGEYIGGSSSEPEKPEVKTAEILAPLLKITFGIIASKKGGHWALGDQEAVELGNAYGDVMDKYFPEVAVGCELTAVMCTLVVVGPRVAEDKRQAAEQKKQEQVKPGVDDAGEE